jgi:hypothetical protein
MTQTLYAHRNKIKIKKKIKEMGPNGKKLGHSGHASKRTFPVSLCFPAILR